MRWWTRTKTLWLTHLADHFPPAMSKNRVAVSKTSPKAITQKMDVKSPKLKMKVSQNFKLIFIPSMLQGVDTTIPRWTALRSRNAAVQITLNKSLHSEKSTIWKLFLKAKVRFFLSAVLLKGNYQKILKECIPRHPLIMGNIPPKRQCLLNGGVSGSLMERCSISWGEGSAQHPEDNWSEFQFYANTRRYIYITVELTAGKKHPHKSSETHEIKLNMDI